MLADNPRPMYEEPFITLKLEYGVLSVRQNNGTRLLLGQIKYIKV